MPLISAAITGLTAATAAGATAAATTAAAAGTGAALAGGAASSIAAGAAAGVGAAAAPAAVTAASAGVGSIASAATTLGTALSVGTTGLQFIEGQKASAAQKEQEAIRKRASEFEFARARREVIRQTQIARATGINAASQSGAELPGSDTLGGVLGQNSTNENYALQAIDQNNRLSNNMFASNAKEAEASGRASLFNAGNNFGQTLLNNNIQIGRIGATLFNA